MRRYYAVPRFLYHFFTLRKNARIEASKLVAIQEKKLRAIVRYAYRNVPFYHKLFDLNNIRPTEINTLSDLKKIPFLTKEDVRGNLHNLISRKVNVNRCLKNRTSGSTGFPLTVFTDRDAQNFRSAVALRQFFECGGKLRDRQVQIRGIGASSLTDVNSKPFYESLGFFRTEWIAIGAGIPRSLLHFLNVYEPDVMVGYPSLFQLIAEQNGEAINPRVVFCTAEILSDDCREILESAFGSRIIDSYGCTEGGDIAWECPDVKVGYHVNCDSVVVEFVKDGENVCPGEEGEIVFTNLFNHAMPLIRYKIGDVGVPSGEECSCGRTLPLMRLLKGRSDDFIFLPDGEKLSPQTIISDQAKNVVEVLGYRIIQEKKGEIEVLLRMQFGYEHASVARFVGALREVIGEDMKITARVVDELPRDSSGKLRRIISKVAA